MSLTIEEMVLFVWYRYHCDHKQSSISYTGGFSTELNDSTAERYIVRLQTAATWPDVNCRRTKTFSESWRGAVSVQWLIPK